MATLNKQKCLKKNNEEQEGKIDPGSGFQREGGGSKAGVWEGDCGGNVRYSLCTWGKETCENYSKEGGEGGWWGGEVKQDIFDIRTFINVTVYSQYNYNMKINFF
jgi:hypothetical protein